MDLLTLEKHSWDWILVLESDAWDVYCWYSVCSGS